MPRQVTCRPLQTLRKGGRLSKGTLDPPLNSARMVNPNRSGVAQSFGSQKLCGSCVDGVGMKEQEPEARIEQ
jgi:hypothetical protein